MGYIVNLSEHRLFNEKQELEFLHLQCTLLVKDAELSSCYGYSDECGFCEVPKYYPGARQILARLQCTGKLE